MDTTTRLDALAAVASRLTDVIEHMAKEQSRMHTRMAKLERKVARLASALRGVERRHDAALAKAERERTH